MPETLAEFVFYILLKWKMKNSLYYLEKKLRQRAKTLVHESNKITGWRKRKAFFLSVRIINVMERLITRNRRSSLLE